jgi:hypothetical protein
MKELTYKSEDLLQNLFGVNMYGWGEGNGVTFWVIGVCLEE